MIDIIIPTIKTQSEVAEQISEMQATAGCDIRIFATCQQISASRNRNLGINQATCNYIIMVDDDMEKFPQDWAKKLSDVMDTHQNCVMVSAQLANPDGSAGFMMGGCQIHKSGVTQAYQKKLPTACVMIRKSDLRFDEEYLGSGIEDDDYCMQLRAAFQNAEFLVCHDVWVVHRNERKHGTTYWDHNCAVFYKKWGLTINA